MLFRFLKCTTRCSPARTLASPGGAPARESTKTKPLAVMNEPRKCPVCGDAIIGRSDKKYCSTDCRFIANNKLKHQSESLLLSTNQALRKNRSIMKTLSPEGGTIVRKTILVKMGFDFRYFTSIFITERRQVYYLSYDFAFTPTYHNGKEKVLIVRVQPYMTAPDPWKYVRHSAPDAMPSDDSTHHRR